MNAILPSLLFIGLARLAAAASPTALPTLIRSSQNNVKAYAGTGSGTSSGTGGYATAAGVAGPRTILQDSTGIFYFNDGTGHCVRKVSSIGILSLYVGTCGTSGFSGDNGPASSSLIWFPVSMLFDTVGSFYITDFTNYRVRYVTTSGIISTIAGTGGTSTTGMGGQATSAQLNSPHGMWLSSTNQIYLSLYQDATIKVFTKGGTVLSVGGETQHCSKL